ncbi:MAG: MAPEG family protein [Pseudomonadota bacterium]
MTAVIETHPILLPMLIHVLLATLLYALLTVVRAPAVWGSTQTKNDNKPWSQLEKKVSANLSNQFEWPVLFYAVSILGIVLGIANEHGFLVLAWVFIGGRALHSLVQICTNNIRLRGIVFTINFLAVLGMWVYLLVH